MKLSSPCAEAQKHLKWIRMLREPIRRSSQHNKRPKHTDLPAALFQARAQPPSPISPPLLSKNAPRVTPQKQSKTISPLSRKTRAGLEVGPILVYCSIPQIVI